MSYIAYELDAANKVPLVANACGIEACKIGWGLACMWMHCFRETVDLVTDRQITGFFGAKGLGETLADFGFLEAQDDGRWRVKGAQRYLRLKEARREGGRKGRAKQLAERALESSGARQKRALRAQAKTRPEAVRLSPGWTGL